LSLDNKIYALEEREFCVCIWFMPIVKGVWKM